MKRMMLAALPFAVAASSSSLGLAMGASWLAVLITLCIACVAALCLVSASLLSAQHPVGACQACGYDLTGHRHLDCGECPECGACFRSVYRQPASTRPGFTLIELLVVVGIVSLVMVATIAALSKMQANVRETSMYNTVAVASSAARQLATTKRAKFDPLTGGTAFGGTAAIIGDDRFIRLANDDRSGTDSYADVHRRDWITMPNRARVFGVNRIDDGTDGGELILIPPPFALHFDAFGSLRVGTINYDGMGELQSVVAVIVVGERGDPLTDGKMLFFSRQTGAPLRVDF